MEPYKILMTKFLGRTESGGHTYEITFNQSIVHTGRWKGIEEGLDAYRQREIEEREAEILAQAEEIKSRKNPKPCQP